MNIYNIHEASVNLELHRNLDKVVILDYRIDDTKREEVIGILDYNEITDMYCVYNVNNNNTNFIFENVDDITYKNGMLKIILL